MTMEIIEYFTAKIEMRVDYYLSILDKMGPSIPPEVEALAARQTDSTIAVFVRQNGTPGELKSALSNILFHLREENDLVAADQALTQFDNNRSAMEGLLKMPFLKTGMKLRAAAKRGGPKKGTKADRNVQMAREYQQRLPAARMSETALKEEIGRKHGLRRSSAVTAIEDGLKKLSGRPS